jgi:hypothetical protein
MCSYTGHLLFSISETALKKQEIQRMPLIPVIHRNQEIARVSQTSPLKPLACPVRSTRGPRKSLPPLKPILRTRLAKAIATAAAKLRRR